MVFFYYKLLLLIYDLIIIQPSYQKQDYLILPPILLYTSYLAFKY